MANIALLCRVDFQLQESKLKGDSQNSDAEAIVDAAVTVFGIPGRLNH